MAWRVYLGVICLLAGSVQAEPLRYIKQQQGEQQVMLWQLSKGEDHWLVEAQEGDRRFRNVVLATGETVRWELASEAVQLQAHVEDGRLVLTGNNGNQAVDQQKDLQGLPWYQPLSFSLAQFLDTGRDKAEFWMVRPDDFSFIKMQAERQGREIISLQGSELAAQRVSVRPTGLLAMLWQADYWFGTDDRQLLKYESSGAMGIAETRVQLDGPVN